MYRIPIDFFIKADSPEEAKIRMEEFLTQALSEFRLKFYVDGWEAPFGYPITEDTDC